MPGSGAGNMTLPRTGHRVITMADGRVLAMGGDGYAFNGSANIEASTTSELYNPSTDTWSASGGLTMPRRPGFNAALLPSGRVLVAGGSMFNPDCPKPVSCSSILSIASTEIWDPSTGAWTRGPDMPVPREGFSMTTLPTGLVLVTGGFYHNPQPMGVMNDINVQASFLFNENTGAWSATGSLLGPLLHYDAVLFPTGREM